MEIPKVEIDEIEIATVVNAEVAAEVEVVVKIDRRTIRTAPHRWLANGKYDKKPNSPTYFRDYYRSQRQPTECQYCHLIFTGRDCLYKHGERSNKCIKLREQLAAEASEAVETLPTEALPTQIQKRFLCLTMFQYN